MEPAVNVEDGRHSPLARPSRPRPADEEHAGEQPASLGHALRRYLPAWLVAYSLNGFFVYLAVLDAVDVRPRTPLTAAYYGLLCVALLATAWRRRSVAIARLRPRQRTVVAFVIAAAALSFWFVLNTALLSDGAFAARLAGLLVLWSIPTALAAATLRRSDLREVARALVALSLGFVAIELVALARAGTGIFRFSPIAELDPISAGLIPAVGAIAALSLQPASIQRRLLQLAAVIVLVAAAVVPGSRGPMIALAFGALSLVLVQSVRRIVISAAAVALGLGLGLLVSSHIGSVGYLASVEPTGRAGQPEDAAGLEITTFSIRRQWLEEAIRDTPDRPIFGHGVGMQVDDTPEAALMGVSGQRTYPHNTLVEAAYSLGAIGLAAYLVFLGSALVALVSVVRRGRRDQVVAFVLPIGVFAFVNTNVSGEIGEDVLLWTVSAIAVALYADALLSRSAA